MTSTFWMDRALALARRAVGLTAPNPAVGAVLVKDGLLIGEGWHRGPGQPHAEAEALQQARSRGRDPRGATLYVTLEPCCHDGPGKRTPPCAPRLVDAGISRVFAAVPDPNTAVAGRGRALLEAAGVGFSWGPRSGAGRDLIADFASWVGPRRPFVTLKWAQSLDGRLVGAAPGSRWITGAEARSGAHGLRAAHDTVAVGAGTIRADDPALTVREARPGPRGQPRRLVFAGRHPLPGRAQVFTDQHRDLTWIVADPEGPLWGQALSLAPGRCLAWDGREPRRLGRLLLENGFYRILVEGGPALLSAWRSWGTWDRAAVFTAPLLLESLTGEPGSEKSSSVPLPALSLAEPRWSVHGPDVLLEGWNPAAPALSLTGEEAPCSPA